MARPAANVDLKFSGRGMAEFSIMFVLQRRANSTRPHQPLLTAFVFVALFDRGRNG
jgi:hypothetical protein